jgi:hypothetical protein
MTFYSIENWANPQDLAEISTTQKLELGMIVRAKDPTYGVGEFIYLKGVASTIAGSWAVYNPDDWSTTLSVADATGSLAIAVGANVASSYGWYQISGLCPVAAVAADVADNAVLYLTATPGMVDDSDVAGDFISGAKAASANATGGASTIQVEISRPFVRDGADN